MSHAPASHASVARLSPWAALPKEVRILFVTTARASAEALRHLLADDRAMSVAVEVALGGADAVARLREENFAALVVHHDPPRFDALEFVEAHRATGAEDPIVVLGPSPEAELSAHCYEVGADAYLTFHAVTPRQIIWHLSRAIQWHALVGENRRLTHAQRQRLRLEHNEAERLLNQQRALIDGLEELATTDDITSGGRPADDCDPQNASACSLPTALVAHYRELLRAFVIMGSGSLGGEIVALARELAQANIPAPKVMQLHVLVLEELLRGLGHRGSRHVMTRADLMVLEVMVHLAEGYRWQ